MAMTAGALLTAMITSPVRAALVSADAIILVNSQSARYQDFQHFIQPYLDNFGFPYAVQDIATNAPDQSIGSYAVIIIGHSQLDTNHAYLTDPAQASLSLAVSNGTGLVNFDNDLQSGGNPRYQFVQDIFGFSYGTAASGASVSLPPTEPLSQMHFITERHPTNDLVALRSSLSLPGINVPLTATTLAKVGSRPLVAVTRYGQGRALQWGSYDWMVSTVLGPVDGLDDVVWRGVVWSARKPFVMRGLPNFVTMRIDDVGGPFNWVHAAINVGFKPFLALFYPIVSEASAADLQSMMTNGQATAGVHSTGNTSSFFYFNHAAEQPWPENVQSNNFYLATQWFGSHGLPMSKICASHYSEIGVNCFAGLKAWGIEYVPIEVVPGTVEYATPGAPWVVNGPYRLYETPQPGQVNWPTYYADWLKVPGHPEFDGQFFNIYSEVRDVSGCGEWCPDNNVSASINRATQIAKRTLDSMAMTTVFTHEPQYISLVTAANWQAILQGLTNNLASYNPIYVTLDYASQYVRATRTSRLVSGAFDPDSGKVTATFSGKTDLDTSVYVFFGADNTISSSLGTVPAFSVAPTNPVVVSGPPLILNEPASRTNDAGASVVLNVGASGAGPLSYRWYLDGTNALIDGGRVSGTGTATLTLSGVLGGDAGSYTVVVTNAAGSVTSTVPAVLTVVDPAITSQPASQSGVVGASAVFSVGAHGTAPTYQWFKNGEPINGATNTTLSLTNLSDGDVGSYSITVSNIYGSRLSSNATLAIFYVPTATNDSYNVAADTTLAVAANGVLDNDAVAGGGHLTARLLAGPIHGTLSLNSDGGFAYTPFTNYAGTDSFTYQAVNGPTNSGAATVTLSITAVGVLFSDGFSRLADPGPLSPWVVHSGNWAATGEVLDAGTNTLQSYGYAYITNSWTDFSVEGRIRFSTTNAWGGGLGGRLNPATGAHYAAWIYPESSPGGAHTLKLIKFQTWTSFGYNGASGAAMAVANLPATGTNWLTLKLAFHGNQVAAYCDGTQVVSVADVEAAPYLSGAISADLWTSATGYAMLLDDVVVRPLVADDSYRVDQDAMLLVPDSGVLGNDTGTYATNLEATLVNGPANGTVNLSSNGGFTYRPATNYYGTDNFSYRATQGPNDLGTAVVMIAVAPLAPAITRPPSSQTNEAGTKAVFSLEAAGALPLSYQWFWNGTNSLRDGGKVSGAHTATLSISNVLGGDAGSYSVVISNVAGSVTSAAPAILTVSDPIILRQPQDLTNALGTTALLSVEAYGTSPSYQWFKGGAAISGATNATLTLAAVSAADAAAYVVLVSNQNGSVTSRVAAVALVPEPTIQSVRLMSGAIAITWSSFAGQLYRLQYRDGVGGITWQDALPDILATGPATTVTNAFSGATQRFYRVILAPATEPPFIVTSIRVAGGTAAISWNSVTGKVYRLQYKSSLLDATWQDLQPDIAATGLQTTATNVLGGATRRFYRVMLASALPPPLVITSLRLTNGLATLTWSSVFGQGYRLQYKDALSDTVWKDLLDVTASGPTTSVTNAVGNADRRFYRVAQVP